MNESPDPIQNETAATPPETTDPPPRSPRHSSWWRWLWLIPAILILLIAAWVLLSKRTRPSPPVAPVAVVAARVHSGNIGVYVSGLGTVIPVYTVSLNSRVDGQLMRVLYNEGQIVGQGELLAEIDPRPFEVMLTQFQGALARDQALLQNARVDLARYQNLLTRSAIPEQTVTTQKALVKQYEGNVLTDQGQIQSAQLNIEYCRITAPIAGRVGLRLVDPGNIVTANATPLLVITQISPISVVFTIGEEQLADVAARFRSGARLQVDAYDRLLNRRLGRGRLATIDNQIDPTTGTVRLRALFETHGELFPNQFVNARLLLQELRNATLVPNAAIQRNGSATFVWTVEPDDTVVSRPVTHGAAGPAETQIQSGVAPGDLVVIQGVDLLRTGTKVAAEISSPGQGQATRTEGDGGR